MKNHMQHKYFKLWSKYYFIFIFIWFVISAPLVFTLDEATFSFENLILFYAYALLSIGVWGIIAYIIISIPVLIIIMLYENFR